MSRKIDDPAFRTRLLDLIRVGQGRNEAAVTVGITPATFARWYKDDMEFRAEVEQALDQSTEPVLARMREMAIDGDVTAAKIYLSHVAPAPRADKEKKQIVEHTINLGPSLEQAKSIAEFQAMLTERAALRALEAAKDARDASALDVREVAP